jgi:acyl-CoA synthetase (AMP-forming)/AMP-acid ligase II
LRSLRQLLSLRAAETPDRVGYAFSKTGEDPETPLTYLELDQSARAIAGWLRGIAAPGDPVLLLLPPGLEFIKAFFGCAYAGTPAVPIAPLRQNENPERIARVARSAMPAIVITTASCVHVVRRELTFIDSVAFNGAEPLHAQTLDRFSNAFGRFGFRRASFFPCYGLAEATLFVSGWHLNSDPQSLMFDARAMEHGRAVATGDPSVGRQIFSCGRPADDHHIAIRNVDSRARLPEGMIGEICVRGPSVAPGYWIGPSKTVDPQPAELSTGDLGFLFNGELYVTGRIKELIIIRGRNIAPQDIEQSIARAMGLSALDQGVAFSVEQNSDERLVVVQELTARTRRTLLIDRKREEMAALIVSQYGVELHDIVFVDAGALSRTTGGKIRRADCRASYLSGRI